MFVVYCLQSDARPSCTYVGASVDLAHRLRQHNGELVGGARYTAKHRPWRVVACATGFATWRDALRFEWAWKRATRRLPRARALTSAVARRERGLQELLTDERWRRRWSASEPRKADPAAS